MNPQLVGLISNNVPKLDGWCSVEKAEALASHILRLKAEVVVEIGVFGGRSLIPMAMACAEQNLGVVIGIDPWEADASIAGETKENAEWWGKLNHDEIRLKFIGHVDRLGLGRFVKIIKARSDDVEPPAVIDLLHLDGNHTDQAVRDVERFAPHIRPGGIIYLDDIHWIGGNVERAEKKLYGLGFDRLQLIDTGGFFERRAVAAQSGVALAGSPAKKARRRKTPKTHK